MNTLTIEAKRSAVRAKWPMSTDQSSRNAIWSGNGGDAQCLGLDFPSVFSRLAPEDKAFAVVCPICSASVGMSCQEMNHITQTIRGSRIMDCQPHPERIQRVLEMDAGESECKCDRVDCSSCGPRIAARVMDVEKNMPT